MIGGGFGEAGSVPARRIFAETAAGKNRGQSWNGNGHVGEWCTRAKGSGLSHGAWFREG